MSGCLQELCDKRRQDSTLRPRGDEPQAGNRRNSLIYRHLSINVIPTARPNTSRQGKPRRTGKPSVSPDWQGFGPNILSELRISDIESASMKPVVKTTRCNHAERDMSPRLAIPILGFLLVSSGSLFAQSVLFVDGNATGPLHDGSDWCL